MKKFLLSVVIALTLLLWGGIAVYAANITDAVWTGVIRITNNSTAATNVAVPFTANTSVYINGGYMNSSANNTAVLSSSGADVKYMPAISGNADWVVWVESIGANSIKNDTLYMGGATDMEGLIRYFPGSGGMTVPDNATLELSDNFTVSVSGFFDTDNGTDKNIVNKVGAFEVFNSPAVAGNITANIYEFAGATTTGAIPPASNNTTGITGLTGAATHWQALLTNDGSTSVVYETDTAYHTDYFNIVDPGFTNGDNITTVTVYWRSAVVAVADALTRPKLKLGSDVTTGAEVSVGDPIDYILQSEALARPGGGDWQASDFANLKIGIDLKSSNGNQAKVTQLYINVAYDPIQVAASVSATGVTSGEKTLAVQAGNVTGNTLHFDGTSTSEIQLATNLNYRGQTNFWVSGQFRLDSLHQSGSSTIYLFGFFKDQSEEWFLRLQTGGLLQLAVRDGTGVSFITSSQEVWNADQWYSFVVSSSSSNSTARLITQSEIVTGTNRQTPTGSAITFGHYDFKATDSFIGELGTFLIGTDSLTLAEEQNLLLGIPPGDETGYYYINEGTGTTITDRGSEGTDGVAGAANSWLVQNRPFWYSITVDNVVGGESPLEGVSVPDNSANWTFIENSVMPYMQAANITIDGILAGSWEWENGSTFIDGSVNSNDATPTFRTTATDAQITAELINFAPISQARAPAFSINISTTGWITENITTSGNFTSNTSISTYPGSLVIDEIATAGETPASVLTLILATVGILMMGLFISWVMRQNQERSLMVKLITMTAGMGFLIAVAAFDMWILYLFVIIGIAIVMASSTRTFAGTGNTGNNMLGFLSMGFVGMTMINRILEGRFLQSTDIDIVREVVAFQPFNVFGLFRIPVPNVSFLTNGIPALMRWDYSFFGGNAQIFQYLLYSVTAVVSFMLFVLVFGAIYQMFSRGR